MICPDSIKVIPRTGVHRKTPDSFVASTINAVDTVGVSIWHNVMRLSFDNTKCTAEMAYVDLLRRLVGDNFSG